MPRPPRVMPTYDPAQLNRIMGILDRASDGRPIDRRDVEASLLEVVQAVGLASDGSEASATWHEFAATEPTAKAERDAFLQLARADDPLELAHRDQTVATVLRTSASLRRRGGIWQQAGLSLPSVPGSNWAELSAATRAEIVAAFKDAAAHVGRTVRRGRQQKTDLDTALLEIADLFLSWTGQTTARHHLPYSVESRFIQFAVAVLEPVGRYFEVSDRAMSRRWERIVLQERKEEREMNKLFSESEPQQKS